MMGCKRCSGAIRGKREWHVEVIVRGGVQTGYGFEPWCTAEELYFYCSKGCAVADAVELTLSLPDGAAPFVYRAASTKEEVERVMAAREAFDQELLRRG